MKLSHVLPEVGRIPELALLQTSHTRRGTLRGEESLCCLLELLLLLVEFEIDHDYLGSPMPLVARTIRFTCEVPPAWFA